MSGRVDEGINARIKDEDYRYPWDSGITRWDQARDRCWENTDEENTDDEEEILCNFDLLFASLFRALALKR